MLPHTWSLQGRVATRVRLEAEIKKSMPEDRDAVAQQARGLWSLEGYGACNTQELIFAHTLTAAYRKWMNDGARLMHPYLEDQENPFPIIDFILAEADDEEDGVGKHQEYIDCAQALFEVLVAAMQRNDIVYMPIAPDSATAQLVERLLQGGIEVCPKRMRHINLPQFELRCVGMPDDTLDEQAA